MCWYSNTGARDSMLMRSGSVRELDMIAVLNRIGGLTTAIIVATLVASPAFAAKAKKVVQPPPPPMPVYSWTGYYVGANAGGACSNFTANRGTFTTTFGPLDPLGFVDFTDRIGLLGQYPTFSGSTCGFIGGGQFGYNVQSANWVWGVEGDFQGTTLKSTDNRVFPAVNVPSLGGFGFFGASSEQASQQVRWLATVRGRAGVLATPMLLIYGTAGLAFGQVSDSYSNTGVPTAFTGVTIAANNNNVQWGFAGGGGAEWAFGGPWSAKVEYIYSHLTDDTVRISRPFRMALEPRLITPSETKATSFAPA
jgi:outer membrane immunogenic protein